MRDSPLIIIEDSDEDFEVLQLLLLSIGIENPIRRYASSKEALDMLRRLNRTDARPQREPLPALILLDLNLPGTDGRELIYRFRSDDRLQSVPIIVLTTSSSPQDVRSSYKAGANSYVVKPVDLDRLEGILKSLVDFWLRASVLPAAVENTV